MNGFERYENRLKWAFIGLVVLVLLRLVAWLLGF